MRLFSRSNYWYEKQLKAYLDQRLVPDYKIFRLMETVKGAKFGYLIGWEDESLIHRKEELEAKEREGKMTVAEKREKDALGQVIKINELRIELEKIDIILKGIVEDMKRFKYP